MSIAITGAGIVSAIGLNKDEVLASLCNCKSGIGKVCHLQTAHTELPVGEVSLSKEEMKKLLDIAPTQEVSRTALMGMLAIRQALEDGGITKESPLRIVLINGTTVAGMDVTEKYFLKMSAGEDLDVFKQHDCGSCTQIMADYFGIFAEVTTISTACSSAANAMLLGANLLKANEADIVVAGGTEALSKFHLNGFNALMILDHAPCRPFDATRAGLNLGEGAAFLVMEREETAHQRGVEIQAYLTGYGNACDAFHQTASSENGEGAYLAMTEALAMAHLSPKDIQYVNAHGTGTPDNDRSESVALKRVFGEQMPLVSSTKSFTGHTTSASGSIEAVICLLAMQHHFVPANLFWAAQMPDGITPTMGVENVALSHVLCNSFGFGGNDTTLVFSLNPVEEAQNTVTGDIQILSRVELTSVDSLGEIRQYVKPLEARRMGKLMKSALLSSLKALEEADVQVPDAIITGTQYGCLENSERLLQQLSTEGETMIKPTDFMQSTHNTISSAIAIKTHCHGYNMTYTQGDVSLDWALRDAKLLLRTGKYKIVLVGCHDETAPVFEQLMQQLTDEPIPKVHSIAMVLSCGE